MPPTEKQVGITVFLCDHEPFQAILKQTVDDFIVNEVAQDGSVVYQNVLGLPQQLPKKEKVVLLPKARVSEGKNDTNPKSEHEESMDTGKESSSNHAKVEPVQMKAEAKLNDAESKCEIIKEEGIKAETERKVEHIKAENVQTDTAAKKEVLQEESMSTQVQDTKKVTALNPNSKKENMPSKNDIDVDSEEKNVADCKHKTSGVVSEKTQESKLSDAPKGAAQCVNTEEKSSSTFDSANFAALDLLFADSNPAPSIGLKEKLLKEGKFLLPVQTNKSERTKVHHWVRDNLKECYSQTTNLGSDAQCVEIVKKGRGRVDIWAKKEEQKNRREKAKKEDPLWVDRKDYIQCTLWKRGRDTMETLNDITRHFKMRPNQLSTAGTKDKRGITVQRLRVRGLSVRKLASINDNRKSYLKGRRCFALGDFEILRGKLARPLALGDLAGNRFTLVLRGIRGEEEEEEGKDARDKIIQALDNVKKYGFINYFGMQRFGSGAVPTHETGFALLRGDYKEAVMNILTPLTLSPVQQGDTINPARVAVENGLRDFKNGKIKATRLLDILPRWMYIEKSIVTSLCEDEDKERPHNYKNAFSRLQKNMKTMYIHAVQSYLWNCMASESISGRTCREFAKKGDLVRSDGNDTTPPLTFSTSVRRVTQEEENAKSVPLSKVIIPVIGRKVTCDSLGSTVESILEKEKLDAVKMFQDYNDDFRGTYRRLLSIPGDLQHEFREYPQGSRYPLVSEGVGSMANRRNGGDKRTLEDGDSDPTRKDVVASEKRRKMSAEIAACKTHANSQEKGGIDVEMKDRKNKDKRGPDMVGKGAVEMETESKAENTGDVAMKEDTKSGVKEGGEIIISAAASDVKTVDEDNGDVKAKNEDGAKKIERAMELALIVSFSLRTSSYATMMIRELTHRPTDTQYHKNLSVQPRTEASGKVAQSKH